MRSGCATADENLSPSAFICGYLQGSTKFDGWHLNFTSGPRCPSTHSECTHLNSPLVAKKTLLSSRVAAWPSAPPRERELNLPMKSYARVPSTCAAGNSRRASCGWTLTPFTRSHMHMANSPIMAGRKTTRASSSA